MRGFALVFALSLLVGAFADDCESSDACDVGSLIQKPVTAAALDATAQVPLLKSDESLVDRFLASWLEVARSWRLGHRKLVKTGDEATAEPKAAQEAKLVQTVTEVHDHNPTDLLWMTMIPTIIIGCTVTAVLGALVMQQVAAGGEEKQPLANEEAEGVKGMTPVQLFFNMVQNIVGEGMLSLPAGIAGGTGLLMGTVIAFFFCSLMGYTFAIMGRTCYATGEKNQKDCAAKVSGPVLGQTMAVVLMLKTMFTCLTYSIVIGESFSRIMHFFGVAGIFSTSQGTLLTITFLILLPLCLQKDLSALSYTSMIGCAGQVWVLLAMQIRYMDGSYRPGGTFYDAIPQEDQPDFSGGGVLYWKTSASTFVLLGSLATAFIAHYNAAKFYSNLRPADRTPDTFNKVTAAAFGFSMIIYFWIMSVGYLTFGKASEGLILNNYSEKDVLATAARIAMGLAVTLGFPLGFTGLREATISVFNLKEDKFVPVTLILLSVIITGGCMFHDLGLANSLGGAIFGALITLIFPALLLYLTGHTEGIKEFSPLEAKVGSFVVLALGVCLMLFGSTLVIITRYFPEVIGK